MWDASMAMEVMPASNMDGMSVRALPTSGCFFSPKWSAWMATGTVMPSSLQMVSAYLARFHMLMRQYPASDLAISRMTAALARWAACRTPRITMLFRALAAIVMALPFSSWPGR